MDIIPTHEDNFEFDLKSPILFDALTMYILQWIHSNESDQKRTWAKATILMKTHLYCIIIMYFSKCLNPTVYNDTETVQSKKVFQS